MVRSSTSDHNRSCLGSGRPSPPWSRCCGNGVQRHQQARGCHLRLAAFVATWHQQPPHTCLKGCRATCAHARSHRVAGYTLKVGRLCRHVTSADAVHLPRRLPCHLRTCAGSHTIDDYTLACSCNIHLCCCNTRLQVQYSHLQSRKVQPVGMWGIVHGANRSRPAEAPHFTPRKGVPQDRCA